MTLPITGNAALWLALAFGFIFGILLHRGRVADYNVIVNQFRFKDFTVLKIMFTAIIVGGLGVLALKHLGYARYDIKPAQMAGVSIGAAIFGVGMVLYGYCPGTGIAAIATGSVHALFGMLGMLVGSIVYAFSFKWADTHLLNLADLGKKRLPDLSGVSDLAWFAILVGVATIVFWLLERNPRTAHRRLTSA